MVRQNRPPPTYAQQWGRSFANILPNLANTALQSTVQGLIQDYFTGRQQERGLGAQQILGEERAAAGAQAGQQARMHDKEMALRKMLGEREEDLFGTLGQAFGLAEEPETAIELMTKRREFARPSDVISMPTPADQPAEPGVPLSFEESIAQEMGGWTPEQKEEAAYAFGKAPGRDWLALEREKQKGRIATEQERQRGRERTIPMRGKEARRTVGLRGRVAGKQAEQKQQQAEELERQRLSGKHPAVKYQVQPPYKQKVIPYNPPGPAGERRGYTPGQPIPKPSRTTPGGTRREQVEEKLGISGLKPAEHADVLDLDSQQLARYQRARKTVDKASGRPFTHEKALQFAKGVR
jgi:hypothetical protein